jgi:cellulose biosynthesis protein BcsQ
MQTIVFAARKGGSGKSTLAAHLAAHVARPSKPVLLVDADPQGSLTLWHGLGERADAKLVSGPRALDALRKAKADGGYEWAFVDTPPIKHASIADIIRLATLVVIPARPSVFDVAAVEETIAVCRACRKPFAVVVNGAPPKRDGAESQLVTEMRARLAAHKVPVWSGQISHRAIFAAALASGQGAKEYADHSVAAAEIAQLWSAVGRSVGAITGANEATKVMHKAA